MTATRAGRRLPGNGGLDAPRVALLTARTRGKRVLLIPPRYTKQDMLWPESLIEAGRYRAVVDRCYPPEDVIEASRRVETEQKLGNVVLTVGHDPGN
jgi:NADPH:quinone reductase-like Zn-dependent oxidoreductase